LWSLYSERSNLEQYLAQMKKTQADTIKKIDEAQQSYFIEYLAREKFHMVEDGDLIFIFSENDGE
jgi:cell division protein FtsB